MTTSGAGSTHATASAHYGVSLIDVALLEHLRVKPDANLDALLELRRTLQGFGQIEPEILLRDFSRLRKTDEFRFYLTFYRLRMWLEFQLGLLVEDRANRIPAVHVPLRLNFRSIDALLNSGKQQAFEHTEDPVTYDDLEVRVIYNDSRPPA